MFRKKLIPTILYWLMIAAITTILMSILLSFAYIGPEDTFFGMMWGVTKTIFIAAAMLGTCTEVIARRIKKRGK